MSKRTRCDSKCQTSSEDHTTVTRGVGFQEVEYERWQFLGLGLLGDVCFLHLGTLVQGMLVSPPSRQQPWLL